ncbi:hypothetical protein KCU81_g8192, partial [Aureobasidium melanogenum]|uniref:Uncharacterized protein n=1 Tax=Aureobasidium melanogenum (strain CBS 110374) TaxID=1043003 RepID=A0A074VW28_AURM1
MASIKPVMAIKKPTASPGITPDAERRVTKQSYHGLSAISLRSHHVATNTIPRDSLALVLRKDLQTALKENKSRPLQCFGHRLVTYNIKDEKSVVEFLAQWVKDMDVAESLRVSMEFGSSLGERDSSPVIKTLGIFHRVISHFSNMNTYNSAVYDSMIDWYIEYIKSDDVNLNQVFRICQFNDTLEEGGLIRVCANVLVHHGETLFTPKNFSAFEFWLMDHIDQSARDTIPGDVMDPAFDQHCAYHHHAEGELCYKQKIREKIQKLSTLV